MSKQDRYLFISDLQIPFEAAKALEVCKRVQKHFKIPSAHIYNVGDELDQYHASSHPKSPDAKLTATDELKVSREKLKAWYAAFPEMKLAVSNHGIRWLKKASHAEIPSELLRCYREVIEAPKGWRWQDSWTIKTDRPIRMVHGIGYGGASGHRTAAMDAGQNTVIGHLHSHAGVAHVNMGSRQFWGMNVGSLIEPDAFAFEYGKWNRFKPWIGLGVVVDSGRTPILIPYEAFA